MEKLLALFVCACLIFGTFSFVSAENGETVAAEAWFTETAPAQSGSLSGENWYMSHDFQSTAIGAPTGKLGALWTSDNLFVAVSTTDAASITVGVGNKTLCWDLAQKSFTQNDAGATGFASDGIVKLCIPFATCGITVSTFGQKVPFRAVLTNATASANLTDDENSVIVLKGSRIIFVDNCDSFSAANYQSGIAYVSQDAITVTDAPDNAGAYRFQTVNTSAENSTNSWRKTPFNHTGGDLSYTLDISFTDLPIISTNYGWRGFAMQTRTDLLRGFAFNKDAQGNVLCGAIVSNAASEFASTGLRLGDRAIITMVYDQQNAATLYVNGVEKHTFSPATHTNVNQGSISSLDILVSHYNRTGTDSTNVDLYGYCIADSMYEDMKTTLQNTLNNINADDLLGENTDSNKITQNLSLVPNIIIPGLNVTIPIVWSSTDKTLLSDDGSVNTEGMCGKVTVKATATWGEYTAEKDFTFNISLSVPDGTVGYKKHDLNPYTGALEGFTTNEMFVLDDDYSSVGIDLREKQCVNRVTLTNTQDISRVEKRNLSLYVSDDNNTYTRVKQWDFLKLDNKIYLYNFETQARFVKVHCHYDSIDSQQTFVGNRQQMITAEQISETDFIGANGGSFAGCICYLAKNTTNQDRYDYAMYIPTEDLKLPEGAYKTDMSDIHFTGENGAKSMLHHYYDGDGFYVRIPYVKAGGSVPVCVYYGNSDAVSVSSGEGTFEVEYGNKTLLDLTVNPKFTQNGKVYTMPNGDVISVANDRNTDKCMYIRRSQDGGRTWDEPQLLVNGDTAINEGSSFLQDGNRVYLIYYQWNAFSNTSLSDSDCKLTLIYTEDNGYTWSAPQTIDMPEHPYALTYSNGIVTSVKDGDGPNVDYVIPYGLQYSDSGSFATATVYSADCGKTWQSGDVIRVEVEGTEGGVSESAVAELADGRLYMLMRCQLHSVVNFYKSYSDDYGKTWSEPEKSNVYATNTLPVLRKDNENILLQWSGHNTFGADTYMRFPLALAYSSDEGITWKQHLDVLANTSWSHADTQADDELMTQTDITMSDYRGSDDALVTWWSMGWTHPQYNHGVLIEDFHDWLYKSQGAYDSFETTNIKNEGWVNAQRGDRNVTPAYTTEVNISDEQTTEGLRSLKFADGANSVVRGSRSIPSMTCGTVSFKAYISSEMKSNMFVELKSAYNTNHHQNAPIQVYVVTQDTDNVGTVGVMNSGNWQTTSKQVSLDAWHTYRIEFDMEDTCKAKLYVDNEYVAEFGIDMTKGDYIANLQFADGSGTNTVGANSCFYIDELIATKTLRNEPVLKLVENYGVHYNDTAKTLTVSVNEATTAVAALVSYQATNNTTEMKDVLFFEQAFPKGDTVLNVSELNIDGANTVKAMLWRDKTTVAPLSAAEETKLNQ